MYLTQVVLAVIITYCLAIVCTFNCLKLIFDYAQRHIKIDNKYQSSIDKLQNEQSL